MWSHQDGLATYARAGLADKPARIPSLRRRPSTTRVPMKRLAIFAVLALAGLGTVAARADDADLIFRKSTKFRALTPNDKLATYAFDDPAVQGVACYLDRKS